MPYILAGLGSLGNIALLTKRVVTAKNSMAAAVQAGIVSQAEADAYIKALEEYAAAQTAYDKKFFAAKEKWVRALSVTGIYAGVLIGPATGGVSLETLKRRDERKHAEVVAAIDALASLKARNECGPAPVEPRSPALGVDANIGINVQGGEGDKPKDDNTTLFIGLGVAAAAFFFLRSKQ